MAARFQPSEEQARLAFGADSSREIYRVYFESPVPIDLAGGEYRLVDSDGNRFRVLQYFQEKVIGPGFERFKQIVADGRAELSIEDVTRLADWSIFSAEEALEEKMIDELGYFEDVVTKAKELAHLDKAQVVEYTRPFSFASIFGAKTEGIFKLDRNTLYELSTPQVMYLWSIH